MDYGALHIQMVHFPIALFCVSWFFDLIGVVTKRETFNKAGFLNLIVAAVFALIAVGTGLLAGAEIPATGEVHELFETHETLAFVVAAGITGLLLWRIAKRGALSDGMKWYYLIIATLCTAAVIVTAHYGGMVAEA